MPLTLFELCDICDNDKKLQKFLEKYKIWGLPPTECDVCGTTLPTVPVERKGRPVYRCTKKSCRREMPASSGGILESSHLNPATFLHFLYFWAHDCAGERLETILGIGHTTVSLLSSRLRLCVANEQAATVVTFGGKGKEVEKDETELGRKPNGLHGHKKDVKSDVIGIYDRSAGTIVLETFDKLMAGDDIERRFGTPRYEDVEGMAREYIAPGSILFTDGAKAYAKVAKEEGWQHAYVDHQNGEFIRHQRVGGKLREVSTQRIDGAWGNFKTWYKARYGAMPDHVWAVLKEWQWRHNHKDEDLFLRLLEHIRDGFYPN